MVRGQCTMPRGQPRRDHADHHDVFFTDVRDDQLLVFRGGVFRNTWFQTYLEVFSLVLGVVGLSLMSGTHVRDFLVIFFGSLGLRVCCWNLCAL